MEITGNTILITGGGSGIGRGLAEAFHAAGNKVIIAGRRKAALAEVTAANPGMDSVTLDVEDAGAIKSFAARIAKDYPALNVLLNNAGIMRPENVLDHSIADAEAMVTTNLLGPIRLTAALLPHFVKQKQAAIINVSSGLAFVPLAMTPTYCATKAAIHSYSQSLRYQLRETSVRLIELVPPYVQTELMGERQANDPNAMALKDFIAESMNLFKSQPAADEILVERVKPLRNAECSGQFDSVFSMLNQSAH